MNLIKDAASVLQTVAPKLGLALGGPLGGLAGSLLAKGIGALLGTKDTSGNPVAATQKEIETALIGGDPATLLAIHNIEADLTKHMADLGVEEEQLAYADTASARGREIAVKDWTPRILAFMFVLGWFTIQGFIMTHVVDAAMRDIVLRTMGTMDMALGLILGYYFGSSAGSRAKDDTVANLAKQSQQ